MTQNRWRSFAVLSGAFLIGVMTVTSAVGQTNTNLKDYRLEPKQPAGETLTKMNDLQTGKVRVKGVDYEANKLIIQQYAQYLIFRATFESYYNLPDTGELKPRASEQNFDNVISDLNSRILVPTPDGDLKKLTLVQAEYIDEFAEQIEKAITAVYAKNPPAIIRVNTARLFALAAKSGAPTHAKTIIAMLNNTYFKVAGKATETPPEVLLYALKAAENLLAAHDPKVLFGDQASRHSLVPAELTALVKILEVMVVKGPNVSEKVAPLLTDPSGLPIALPPTQLPEGAVAPPDGTTPKVDATVGPKELTAEQLAVTRFFRRQAIRALAKVRFDTLKDAPDVRPAYTLAKVAVSDPTLSLKASPADVAEAVIGLCGMTPTNRDLQIDGWAYAIAIGVNNFVQPRLTNNADKSLPWKTTAARLNMAMTNLKTSIPNNLRLRPAKKQLDDLIDLTKADLLTPLEKDVLAGVNVPTVERLGQWIIANPPKDPSRSLYTDSPNYKLIAGQPRQ